MDSLPPLRVYALFMVSVCAQTEFFLICPHAREHGHWQAGGADW